MTKIHLFGEFVVQKINLNSFLIFSYYKSLRYYYHVNDESLLVLIKSHLFYLACKHQLL